MAFRLTKDQMTRKGNLVSKLQELAADIQTAVDTYNGKMEEAWAPVEDAINKYNDELSEAKALTEEIAEAANSEFDDKSERWQEGERAQAVSEWKDNWENLDLDEVSADQPDQLDIDQPAHGDELGALPDEPDEV